MTKTLAGLMTVLLLVPAAAPVAAQSPLRVTVTRNGAPAANVAFNLQLADGNRERLGATGADGLVDLLLGAANDGKPLRVRVVTYDCPNDVYEVAFVAVGAEIPEEKGCKKRALIAFWFGRARGLLLDLAAGTASASGGQAFINTTGGKLALVAGGAAAAGVALASGGGAAAPNANRPNTPPSGGGTGDGGTGGGGTGGGGSTSPTSFNATYAGNASATTNGCGFLATTPIRGVLNVNGAGAGTWVKTHVTQNQVFNFEGTLNVTGSQGSFTSTSTSNPFGYVVTDTMTIVGNTATVLQVFRDPSRGNCETRYSMTLTRQ